MQRVFVLFSFCHNVVNEFVKTQIVLKVPSLPWCRPPLQNGSWNKEAESIKWGLWSIADSKSWKVVGHRVVLSFEQASGQVFSSAVLYANVKRSCTKNSSIQSSTPCARSEKNKISNYGQSARSRLITFNQRWKFQMRQPEIANLELHDLKSRTLFNFGKCQEMIFALGNILKFIWLAPAIDIDRS